MLLHLWAGFFLQTIASAELGSAMGSVEKTECRRHRGDKCFQRLQHWNGEELNTLCLLLQGIECFKSLETLTEFA